MILPKEGYKICSQCNDEKILDDFSFENKETGQRRANCKDCKNAASKRAYEDNRYDVESVARHILKICRRRAKERLRKYLKRRDHLDVLPDVPELTEEYFNIDLEWILQRRLQQGNKCFYSGKEMEWSIGYIDNGTRMNPNAVTIERLNSSGPYTKDNCVLACWRANCFKGDGLYEEMIDFAFDITRKHMNDRVLVSNTTDAILNGTVQYSIFIKQRG